MNATEKQFSFLRNYNEELLKKNTDRAERFFSFSAFTWYDAAIIATARLTDQMKIDPDDSEKVEINDLILFISENLGEDFVVVIIYFQFGQQ